MTSHLIDWPFTALAFYFFFNAYSFFFQLLKYVLYGLHFFGVPINNYNHPDLVKIEANDGYRFALRSENVKFTREVMNAFTAMVGFVGHLVHKEVELPNPLDIVILQRPKTDTPVPAAAKAASTTL